MGGRGRGGERAHDAKKYAIRQTNGRLLRGVLQTLTLTQHHLDKISIGLEKLETRTALPFRVWVPITNLHAGWSVSPPMPHEAIAVAAVDAAAAVDTGATTTARSRCGF